jgi:uncharacterized membrane protein
MVRPGQPYAREGVSAQEIRARWARSDVRNVGRIERMISVATGGALAWYGIRRADLLGALFATKGAFWLHRGLTGHCFMLGAMGLSTAGKEWLEFAPRRGADAELDRSRAVRAEHSVTILRSPAELYAFWRDFRNLPIFMRHLEFAGPIDGGRSHWKVKAPGGVGAEWDAMITDDVPNHRIAWKSVEPAAVANSGEVRFAPAPGGRGTEVTLVVEYEPPAGAVGRVLEFFSGEKPSRQVHRSLTHLKQLVEAGEVPTTDGQPQGSH